MMIGIARAPKAPSIPTCTNCIVPQVKFRSDRCSSPIPLPVGGSSPPSLTLDRPGEEPVGVVRPLGAASPMRPDLLRFYPFNFYATCGEEIGRASCRERV